MAVKIRMKRLGRRNRPFYRVVVIDSRKRRDGKPIEELGWYNPIQRVEKNYELNIEKIVEWIEKGAQLSDTVRNLLKKEGVLYRMHLKKQGMDDKTIDYEIQKWSLDREDRVKVKAEKVAQKKAEAAAKKKAELESAEESESAEEPVEEPASEEEAPVEEESAEESDSAEEPVEEPEESETEKNNK